MLSDGPLSRIDNIFLNTGNVSALISSYSDMLGIPIRREQVLREALTWAEIGYGGMEMSFRLADATTSIHPQNKQTFVELAAGQGATISFEVDNMESARKTLEERGVEFLGPTIPCTDGQELISIFRDHRGRPVQLYAPAFRSGTREFQAAGRGSGAGLASIKTFAEANRIQLGSNLLDIRGLGLCAAYDDDAPFESIAFYAGKLQLPYSESDSEVTFKLDHSRIRFRVPPASAQRQIGATIVFEVADVEYAIERAGLFSQFSAVEQRRGQFRDSEGNTLEFWLPN